MNQADLQPIADRLNQLPLLAAQAVLQTEYDFHFGIEVLSADDGRYNPPVVDNAIAYYANVGDPYRPTVLYDVGKNQWLAVSGYGDWLEENDLLDYVPWHRSRTETHE